MLHSILELCYCEMIDPKDEGLDGLVTECKQKLSLATELKSEKAKIEKNLEEALSRIQTLEETTRRLEGEAKQGESFIKSSEEETEPSETNPKLESLQEVELRRVTTELEAVTKELAELKKRVRSYEEALEEKEGQLLKLHTRLENSKEESRQKVRGRLTAGRNHSAVRREDCSH
jgi:chromosome segregation ATPase